MRPGDRVVCTKRGPWRTFNGAGQPTPAPFPAHGEELTVDRVSEGGAYLGFAPYDAVLDGRSVHRQWGAEHFAPLAPIESEIASLLEEQPVGHQRKPDMAHCISMG